MASRTCGQPGLMAWCVGSKRTTRINPGVRNALPIVISHGHAARRSGAFVLMVSAVTRLGDVEPRERAGAQTGRKYEYQYERTARAALDLLSDGTKHVCVYCDWHDD